jgi:hypothetical protein
MMTDKQIIIYAIKNLDGNYYNSIHKEFRTVAQNTAFYKNEKLARSEMLHSLRRHHSTQYDKRKDKARGADYYKELNKYVKQHFDASCVYVVALKIEEMSNNE